MEYVDAGGSLLATFETSMYTERNVPRSDFGLADVFGIRKAGDVVGTVGNAYLARAVASNQEAAQRAMVVNQSIFMSMTKR
jgi:hypothetical protein